MRFIISILIILFGYSSGIGQDYITKSWFKYKYQDASYSSSELGTIMQSSEESMRLYNSGISKKNTGSNLLTYGFIGSAGGYIVMWRVLSDNTLESPNVGGAFMGLIINLIGTTLATIGLIKFLKGQKIINNSVNHFNWESSQGLTKTSEYQYLEISSGAHGIGLRYNF